MGNPLRNDGRESQQRRFAQLVTVLEKYFAKWMLLPGSNQVSPKQIGIYAEALIDLGSDALEYGCMKATQTAERFPWPGHIRKAAEGFRPKDDRSGYLGARGLEWNQSLELERRLREQEYQRQLTNGEAKEKPKPEEKKKYNPPPPVLSIEQQKKVLREKGFLQ